MTILISFFFSFSKKESCISFFPFQFYSPHSHSYSTHFDSDVPHSHPNSPHSHPIPHILRIPRIPTPIPCIPTPIPFPDSPFRLLQIASTLYICDSNGKQYEILNLKSIQFSQTKLMLSYS